MTPCFLTTPELRAMHMHQALELLAPVVHEAARGEFDLADIERMAHAERIVVGVGLQDDGTATIAMAFEFVSYPSTNAINVLAIGGRDMLDFIEPWWEHFKQWAREAEVFTIEASCSAAMARMLKPLGFEPTYHVVRTNINRRAPCHV